MTTTRAYLVDDHALFRKGLADVLTQAGITIAGEAASGEEALAAFPEDGADVVLMDLHMPGMGGAEATRKLADRAAVLVLTVSENDEDLITAIHAGAAGYLLKNATPTALVDAVTNVANGGGALSPEITPKILEAARTAPAPEGPALSAREREIVTMLSQGLSNRQIAERLGISTHTVKTYIDRVFEKYGVRTRAAVAAAARSHGLT